MAAEEQIIDVPGYGKAAFPADTPRERINQIVATSPEFAVARVTTAGPKGSKERQNALMREQDANAAAARAEDPGASWFDPIAAYASSVPKSGLGMIPGAISTAGAVADVIPGLHEAGVGPALQHGADYLNKGLEYAFPTVPGNHWIAEALGSGTGSLLAMGLTGGLAAAAAPARAAQAAKTASLVANFLAEGGGAAQQDIERAEREGTADDRSYGAALKRAAKTLGYAGFSTATEAYLGAPKFIGKFFERGTKTGLWPAIKHTLPEWIVGPAQESVQQIGQDVIVDGKPNWDNILPAAVGGLVQGPFATAAHLGSQFNARQLANQIAPLREQSEGMTQLQNKLDEYAKVMDVRNLTDDEQYQVESRRDEFIAARAQRENIYKSVGMAKNEQLEGQFLEMLKKGGELGPKEELEVLQKIGEGRMAAEALELANTVKAGYTPEQVMAMARERAQKQFEWQKEMSRLTGLSKRETIPGQPIPILEPGEILDDIRSLAIGQRAIGNIAKYANLTPLQRGAIEMLSRNWTPEVLTPQAMPEAIDNVRERTAYPERKVPSIQDIWTFAGMRHEPSAGWFTEAQNAPVQDLAQLAKSQTAGVPSDKKRGRRVRGAQQEQEQVWTTQTAGGSVPVEGQGAQAPAAGGVLQTTEVTPTPEGGATVTKTTTVKPGKRRYRAGSPVGMYLGEPIVKPPGFTREVKGSGVDHLVAGVDQNDDGIGQLRQLVANFKAYANKIGVKTLADSNTEKTSSSHMYMMSDPHGENTHLVINPIYLANLIDTYGTQNAANALYEELVHGVMNELMINQWRREGSRPGNFLEWRAQKASSIISSWPQELRSNIERTYGSGNPESLLFEYIRMLIQQKRHGNITEQMRQGLTPRMVQFLKDLVAFLKGESNLGASDPWVRSMIKDIEDVLNLVESGKPEAAPVKISPREKAAARRFRAGAPVTPTLLGRIGRGLRGAVPDVLKSGVLSVSREDRKRRRRRGAAPMAEPTQNQLSKQAMIPGVDFYDSILAQRLGATIRADPTLDRAASASIDDGGNIEILYNPDRWKTMDETMRRVVMNEEIIHAAHYVLLADEWEKAGNPGRLNEYIENRLATLSKELPENVRKEVAERYGATTDAQIFVEYVRALVQQARTGRISESYIKGLTQPVIAYIRNLIKHLKSLMQGNIHPAVKKDFDNINQLLDLVERKSPEAQKTGEVESGIPAAQRERVASVLQELGKRFGVNVNSVNADQAAHDLLAGALPSIKNKAQQLKVSDNPAAIAFMMAFEKQIPLNEIKTEEELREWAALMLEKHMGKDSRWRKPQAKVNWQAEVAMLKAAAEQGNQDAGRSLSAFLNHPETSVDFIMQHIHRTLLDSRDPWTRNVYDAGKATVPYTAPNIHTYAEAVLAKWLDGRSEPTSSAPGFIEPVFQELYNAVTKEKGVSVENKYRELSSKQIAKFQKEELKDGRVWIKIPSQRNDPGGFNDNAKILQSISCRGWCTYQGSAERLLSQNDFYLLMNGPLAQAAIVINPDGTVMQVQDHTNRGYSNIVGDLKIDVDKKLNEVAPDFLSPKLKTKKPAGGLANDQMRLDAINQGLLDNDLEHQANKDWLKEFLKPRNFIRGNVVRDLAANPNVNFWELLHAYKQAYIDPQARPDNIKSVTAVMLRRADTFSELHAILNVNPDARNSIVFPMMVRKFHGVGDMALREAMAARNRPVVRGVYAQQGAYKPPDYTGIAHHADPKLIAEAIEKKDWAAINKHGLEIKDKKVPEAEPEPEVAAEPPPPDPIELLKHATRIKEQDAKALYADRTSSEMEKVYNELIDRYAQGDSRNGIGTLNVPRESHEALSQMMELDHLKQLFARESPGTATLNNMLLRIYNLHKSIKDDNREEFHGLRNIFESTLRELIRTSPKVGKTVIRDIVNDISNTYRDKGYVDFYPRRDFEMMYDYPEVQEYVRDLARNGKLEKEMLREMFRTHSRRVQWIPENLRQLDKHYDILKEPKIWTNINGGVLRHAFGDRINELPKDQIPGSQRNEIEDSFRNEFSVRATELLPGQISRMIRGYGEKTPGIPDAIAHLSNKDRKYMSEPISQAEKFGSLLNVLVGLSSRAWAYLPTIDVSGFSHHSMEDLRTVIKSLQAHPRMEHEIIDYVQANTLMTKEQKAFLLKRGPLDHLSLRPDMQVQAYYLPSDKSLNFNLDNIADEREAIAKFFHELTHGRIDKMSSNPETVTELNAILHSAEKNLVEAVERRLKEEGWPSLEALIKEYGFDLSTESGRNAYLGELLSRYAEQVNFNDAPPWYKTLLNAIRVWLAKHLNINLSEADINLWLRRQMNGLASEVRASEPEPTTREVQGMLDVIPPPPGMRPTEEEGPSPVVARAAGKTFKAGSPQTEEDEDLKIGMDQEAVINLLKGNQDGGKKIEVMERELVQNALDEVRRYILPTGDPEIYYHSNISDKQNPKGATYKIIIGDNGRGMSPKFLVTKYIQMGGTTKQVGDSGGLGIAKGQFFGNANKFIVDSLWTDPADGTRYLSTVRGNPRGFLIAQRDASIKLKKEGVTEIAPGLTIEVHKIEKDSDLANSLGSDGTFVTGEKSPIFKTKRRWGSDDYPNTEEAIDWTRRFNPNIEWYKNHSVEDRDEDITKPYYTLMQRVGMRRSGAQTQAYEPMLDHSIDTPYATIDIMSANRDSLDTQRWHQIPVYSNGVYQFTQEFNFKDDLTIPSRTFINIKSKVKGSDDNYPFPLDRNSLKPEEATPVAQFFGQLQSQQRERKNNTYRNATKNAPKVAGTNLNVLDVTQKLPQPIVDEIANSPITGELMKNTEVYLEALKKVLEKVRGKDQIKQGWLTGILTGTHNAYGTNFGKTGEYGQIYIDPFLTSELVPEELKPDPEVWGEEYAMSYTGVLLHELMHQLAAGEDQDLSRELTFHGGRLGSESMQFRKAKNAMTKFWQRPDVQEFIQRINDEVRKVRIRDDDALAEFRSASQQLGASSTASAAGSSAQIFGKQPGLTPAGVVPGGTEADQGGGAGAPRRFEAGAPRGEAEATVTPENTGVPADLSQVEVVRNRKGQLVAPNGKVSNLPEYTYRQVRTPRFKAWFGDWENDPENASKIVDDNGEPKIVYHGSQYSFGGFDEGHNRSSASFSRQLGNHFAADPSVSDTFTIGKYASVELPASDYIYDEESGEFDEDAMRQLEVEPGGQTYAVFLNMRNPLDIRVVQEGHRYEGDDDAVQRAVALVAVKQSPSLRQLVVDGLDQGDPSRLQPDAAEEYLNSSTHALPRAAYLAAKQAFIDAGYDGVIYTNNSEEEVQSADDPTSYIITSPKQAKSAIGNSGDFDPNAPPKKFLAGAPQGKAAITTIEGSPGLEPAQVDRVKKVAGVQRQMVPQSSIDRIASWLNDPDLPVEQERAGVLLKWLHDYATSIPTATDIAAAAGDPQLQKELALRAVEMTNFVLRKYDIMSRTRERKWKALDKAASAVPSAIAHDTAANYLARLIKDVPALYAQYLSDRLKAAKGNPVIESQIEAIKHRATIRGGILDEATVSAVLQAMADDPSIPAGSAVRKSDILNALRAKRASLAPGGDATTLSLLLDGGPGGLGPALNRMGNLGRMIEVLRDLRSGRSTAAADAHRFSVDWGRPGGSVTMADFARRFRSFVLNHKKNSDAAEELFKEYGNAKDWFNAYDLAVDELAKVIQSPEFKAQGALGSKILNVRPHGQMQYSVGDASHIINVPDVTDKKKTNTYRISIEQGKDIEKKNIEQINKAIDNINDYLANPEISEVNRYSYNEILAWLINQKNDTTWGTAHEGLRGYHFRHTIQNLGPLPGTLGFTGTLRGVLREITGRAGQRAERLASMVDRHEGVTRGVAENKTYGDYAINTLVGDAMKAHGMDPKNPNHLKEYEELASAIFDSRQHTESQHLKVGDFIPYADDVQVLPEDMKLIGVMKQHDDALKQIGEEGLSMYGEPLRIEDQIADVHLNRHSVAKGPNVVARRYTQKIGDYDAVTWSKLWQKKTEAEKNAEINKDENFRQFIMGHATSTNPDYKRGDERYEQAFKEVTRRIRGGLKINDFNDLARAVANAKGEPLTPAFIDELRKSITDRLRSGLDQYTSDRVDAADAKLTRDEVAGNIKGTADPLKRMHIRSLNTEGSFIVPRGAMYLPGTFYQYARTMPSHRAQLRANAVNISRVKLIGAVEQVIAALRMALKKMEADIESHARTGGEKGRAKRVKELRKTWRAGGEGSYTFAQLQRILKRLERESNWAYQSMLERQEGFNRSKTEIMKSLKQLLGLNLLASFNAQLTNITGGTALPVMITRALINNYRSVLGGVATVPWRIAKTTAVAGANQLSKIPGVKGVARNLSKITGMNGVYRAVGDAVRNQNQVYNDLVTQGIITPFDWKGRGTSRAHFGRFGPAMPGDKADLGRTVSFARILKNNRFTDAVSMASPRWADMLANMIAVEEVMKQTLWMMSKAEGIAAGKPATLSAADASNPAYQITAKDMGISEQQLTMLRNLLRETGSLEEIMFDYIARRRGAPVPGDVPFFTKPNQEKFIRSISYLGNLVNDSNSPAWYRTGDLQSLIGQFGSWPANARDALSLLAMARRAADSGKKDEFDALARAILIMLLLTIIGAGSRELGAEVQDWLTNRAPSKARLGNVANNPISWDGFRYALVSLGQLIPYVGNWVDRMLGGGNSRPILDATSAIPVAGLAANVGDVAVKILQGGDPVAAIADFSNRWLPINSAVNRIPPFSQYQEMRNALRSARAGLPGDIETRPPSAGSIKPGPLTADMAKLERAAYAGDQAEVQRIYTGMVDKVEKDKGLTHEEAERRVQSGLRSKTLENRLFGRQLTESEFGEFTGNLTGGQRANVEKAFAAERMIRGATGMTEPQPRSGSVAATPGQRRTRGAKKLTFSQRRERSRKLRRTRLLKPAYKRRRTTLGATRSRRKERDIITLGGTPSGRRRLRSAQDITLSEPYGRKGRRKKNNLLFLESTTIEP